jgi:Asp-tRNA(Asn)/Glu-tRNA(Gln) amidotransferase A subunit family amidase
VHGTISPTDSTLVTRLRRAGLVIIGKTNTPEFGMTPTCESALYGPARNPWDPTRSTSGSSGGSAAAVAAALVPMTHANDLGGSIRYPASACGVFGVKPTRGRVSLAPQYGEVVGGWAIEHAVTRSVRDSAALLDAVAGPEPGDPYVAPAPIRPFAREVGADPGRLRIGYTASTADGTPGHPDCIAALDDAVRLCADLGHDLVEASLPGLTEEVGAAIGTVYQSTTAWIIDYWTRRLGRPPRPGELEPLTEAFWTAGRAIPAGRYLIAMQDLQAFARVIARFMSTIDVWLTPDAVNATVAARRDHLNPATTVARHGTRRHHRRVPRRGRQHHRQPGDVGTPLVERRRPPHRGALPRPVRGRGDPVPAGHPTRGRPTVGQSATQNHCGLVRAGLPVRLRRGGWVGNRAGGKEGADPGRDGGPVGT